MFHNALLVAVEGVDGAGKNTLTRKVSALLESSGKHISHIAFPRYGTLHADLAAAALHGEMGDLVESAYAMATLFALDRRESLQPGGGLAALVDTPAPDTQVVQTAEPSQEISRIIMMDRWVASNAAYSAARLRESIQQPGGVVEWVAALEYGQFQLPAPDITILLDVPVALARKRAAQREASDTARRRDLYEHDSSLQERTASAYRDLAHAHWYGPWLSVSADVNPEDVARAILAAKIGVPPHRG